MLRPSGVHIDRSTEPGHALLRATSTIENVGAGPLEIRGLRASASTMTAQQAIIDVSGRWHVYPTTALLDFKYVPGHRYGGPSVGDFSYWKLRYAAVFELWSLDAGRHALRLVRTGPKLDYCLRDLLRTHPSRHSPRRRVYRACRQDPQLERDTLGTSAGWSDRYPYRYPAQWVDVTGLRGTFALAQIADPLNVIQESNEADNVSEVYVLLPSGRVVGHRAGVSAP